MKWYEAIVGLAFIVSLGMAAKAKGEDRPTWTAVTCYYQTDQKSGTPAECVARTLTNLMTPEVAVKAKVVRKYPPQCTDGDDCQSGYIIFYPSK